MIQSNISDMAENLLQIQDLSVEFRTDEGVIRAVDGVSFDVPKGKTLGVVGESGCGKSVTAMSVMQLIPTPPGRFVGGNILYDGTDILKMPKRDLQSIRGNRISMIFQEPMTSLNPVFTVGDQIGEAFRIHQGMKKKAALEQSVEMLRLVGIPAPEQRVFDYPHQLSGGMRQRVMIAMALACKPDLLIADEPTTALDVTIQAQIMDLMLKLQKELGMSLILITHDLAVVADVCDEVVVMYAGRVVERGSVHQIFHSPQHPYTRGLLNSIPGSEMIGKAPGSSNRLQTIPGMVPNLLHLKKGCRFQDRCFKKRDLCTQSEPELTVDEKGQSVRCFYQL